MKNNIYKPTESALAYVDSTLSCVDVSGNTISGNMEVTITRTLLGSNVYAVSFNGCKANGIGVIENGFFSITRITPVVRDIEVSIIGEHANYWDTFGYLPV